MFLEDRVSQQPVLAALAKDEAGLLARFGLFLFERLEPGTFVAARKKHFACPGQILLAGGGEVFL